LSLAERKRKELAERSAASEAGEKGEGEGEGETEGKEREEGGQERSLRMSLADRKRMELAKRAAAKESEAKSASTPAGEGVGQEDALPPDALPESSGPPLRFSLADRKRMELERRQHEEAAGDGGKGGDGEERPLRASLADKKRRMKKRQWEEQPSSSPTPPSSSSPSPFTSSLPPAAPSDPDFPEALAMLESTPGSNIAILSPAPSPSASTSSSLSTSPLASPRPPRSPTSSVRFDLSNLDSLKVPQRSNLKAKRAKVRPFLPPSYSPGPTPPASTFISPTPDSCRLFTTTASEPRQLRRARPLRRS